MSPSACRPEETQCLRVVTEAVLSMSFIVGVLGNGLVLWMTAFRMARTVTTVWFFNLALADFTVSLSLPISIHVVKTGEWPLGTWGCKLYMAFLALNFLTSICLLVLISVDRCVSVLCPVWARNHRTVQRATWLAAGVWLLSAAICSPPYLMYRAAEERGGCVHCFFKFEENDAALNQSARAPLRHAALAVTHFVLGFLTPLAIIGACAHLIRAKLRQEGWVHAGRPKRLLLVLVSAFFIFWFPFNVLLLVQMILEKFSDPNMLLFLWTAFSLGCLNSCLNPFLYVFIGRDFQEKFFQTLPSALARAFGEEGLSHPGPEEKPPGEDGRLQAEAGRLPS
ncbi:putative G-protein coupled receptor 32 [Tupaia chinensis]|uniref:Putative G-protein coupled receptor 32 n=1 Tax=Tupaia chinensis TaxID=246437 RepID=L9L263_TUPCH|nr:putative G-protein coupled receptor 32 [Tupaia chinensis]